MEFILSAIHQNYCVNLVLVLVLLASIVILMILVHRVQKITILTKRHQMMALILGFANQYILAMKDITRMLILA